MAPDCDSDTLLIQVEQTGAGACHTGQYSCFGADNSAYSILDTIYAQIVTRAGTPKKDSYTNYLLGSGLDKICKKLGEEMTETIVAAKNENKAELVNEIADVVYHTLVLMFSKGIAPKEIAGTLSERHKTEGNLKPKHQKGGF
jgi:phosphoribosyl-ATP pyrophosphohydrolase/phosphoribosyl-AMP cyclohydrolase